MDPTAWSFAGFNWLGLAAALVANVVIGFLWYSKWSPTGKIWMRDQGLDPATMPKPPAKEMATSMILMLVGAFLLMFVLAHDYWVYQDAYRNTATHGKADYSLSPMDGVMGGVFTWLGFMVPVNLNRVAFERQKWPVYFVNVGYYLVTLVVAGLLLATVGKFTNP
ncbi:MAG: DUF1761 domain-containing protein [bacterium]